MAFCPQCKKEMGQTETICPHCGYDFPIVEPEPPEPSGMAYSNLAEIALVVGEVAAIIGAIASLSYAAILLLSLDIISGLIAVIGGLLSVANFVVFARIRDMGATRTR